MIKFRYFIFKNKHLARSIKFGKFEWFEYGKWVENTSRSQYLMDCMMDYGDVSAFDYEEISEEQANKIITKWKETQSSQQ